MDFKTPQDVTKDAHTRMHGSVEALKGEYQKLRTARAHTGMLDEVKVEAYGQKMKLRELASVSAPEARLLVVKPYDVSQLSAVEKAINAADLGFNASNDGKIVRVPLPDLSEERRKEIVKFAKSKAEETRVAIRNVRRDANEHLKKLEKDGTAKDAIETETAHMQKLTDDVVRSVDELVKNKEKDIMTV